MKMNKGFTLIEIMIVVAIIAILAAIAIPNFISYRKTSQMNACIANLRQLDSATEAWRVKNPNSDTELTLDLLAPTDGSGFLKSAPTCPAGGSYSAPVAETDHWTCSYSDSDSTYKHTVTPDAAE